MNGNTHGENGPGRLADQMAELLKRFRHFAGQSVEAPGLASHLARIKISARLLPDAGLPAEAALEGVLRLSGVLAELVARYESVPESLPQNLGPPVGRLADYLEEILDRCDRGDTLAEVAADGGWETIRASFTNAGTPLEVFEDTDDLFRKWAGQWDLDDLTPIQVKNLGARWLRLKDRGDRLFLADDYGPGGNEVDPVDRTGARMMVLLVDSSFRRERIRDKLVEAGYRVEVPADPGRALDHLAAEPSPVAVLCDNLEPTRHLVRLADEVSGHGPHRVPPFILVAGKSLSGRDDDLRARSLGAAAAWTDPFDPARLRRILQRLSQP